MQIDKKLIHQKMHVGVETFSKFSCRKVQVIKLPKVIAGEQEIDLASILCKSYIQLRKQKFVDGKNHLFLSHKLNWRKRKQDYIIIYLKRV